MGVVVLGIVERYNPEPFATFGLLFAFKQVHDP
jgi:hypothetical protein